MGRPVNNRIIPARAGFTGPSHYRPWRRPDHPRSRGVYRGLRPRDGRGRGSSPLARGLQPALTIAHTPRGIIPARAGFTNDFKSKVITAQDHPRSRGVYAATPRIAARMVGSSPLARGLLVRFVFARGRGRIIPARAGFTALPPLLISGTRDHPRSRGVYGQRPMSRLISRGSSPLARGLRNR